MFSMRRVAFSFRTRSFQHSKFHDTCYFYKPVVTESRRIRVFTVAVKTGDFVAAHSDCCSVTLWVAL